MILSWTYHLLASVYGLSIRNKNHILGEKKKKKKTH